MSNVFNTMLNCFYERIFDLTSGPTNYLDKNRQFQGITPNELEYDGYTINAYTFTVKKNNLTFLELREMPDVMLSRIHDDKKRSIIEFKGLQFVARFDKDDFLIGIFSY